MAYILRALNGVLGAMMILAGVLLARQPWIDIAQAPESDAFRLIQFHFFLTGSFSLWALSTPKRDGLLTRFSLLLLGLNGWLGFLALFSNDAGLLWPVGFFAVSAINFAYLLATDAPTSDGDNASEADTKADGEVEGLIPADFGVNRAGGRAKSALVALGAIGLMIGAVLALIFFGAIYATLLKAAIFDGASISFARVAENLRQGAGDEALMKAGIAIVVTTVVYGFVFLIEAVVAALLNRKQKIAGIDLDRSLTRDERVYARDALIALANYLEAREFKRLWRSLYVIGVIGVIASFLAVPAALFWTESVIDANLKLARGGGVDSVFYSGAIYLGGAIGGFFAGALLFWSLFQYLGARFPEFGEYLFAQAGWNSMNNRPRAPEELLWVLVRHIRARMLDIRRPFDPRAFLYAAFRERESIIYKSTALSIVLAGLLTYADLARYEAVDESGVAYSKYLQFASQRVDFAELDRVELRCALLGPNDDGEINLGVSYILVMDGEFRIDLLDGSERDPNWLARLEALDGKLSSLGVPVRKAAKAGFLQGDRPSFVSSCAREIAARYPPEIAPRLVRLLRVDRFGAAAARRAFRAAQLLDLVGPEASAEMGA